MSTHFSELRYQMSRTYERSAIRRSLDASIRETESRLGIERPASTEDEADPAARSADPRVEDL